MSKFLKILNEISDRGLIKAHQEGFHASEMDKKRSENPYRNKKNKNCPNPTTYANAWDDGWMEHDQAEE